MPDIKTALTAALEQGKRQYLQATISDWEHHEQEIRTQPQPQQEKAMQTVQTTTTPTFQTTGVISKDTFEYIKQNSGKFKGADIAKNLAEKHNFNPGSVLALITQLKGIGMIERKDDGTLVSTGADYQPVTSAYKNKIKTEKRAKRLEHLAKAREVRAANAAKRKADAAKKAAKPAPQKTLPKPATQGIAALQPAPTPMLPNLPTAESVLNNMSIVEARKLYDELKKIFG